MRRLRFFAILLSLALFFGTLSPAALASSPDTALDRLSERTFTLEGIVAVDLRDLNLLQGVSDTDFDLERQPTRLEALILLIRLLGQEEEALGGHYTHPFTDVPHWADAYVGYAYQKGLTYGISEDQFGMENAGAATCLTFVLRALGYLDNNNNNNNNNNNSQTADFQWDNPFSLAGDNGLLPPCIQIDDFLRADMVLLSYAALSAHMKDSDLTLADTLVLRDVFTEEEYETVYHPEILTSGDTSASVDRQNRSVTVQQTLYVLGMSEKKLIENAGMAERVLNSTPDFQWYFFGLTSTDGAFLMAGVTGDQVAALCVVGQGFRYQGLQAGDRAPIVDDSNLYATVYADRQNDNALYMVRLQDPRADLTQQGRWDEDSLAAEAWIVHCLSNAFRSYHSQDPLTWSPVAAKAATLHSQDMAERGVVDHIGSQGQTLAERLAQQGLYATRSGENILEGYGTGISAFASWVNDEQSREQMLGAYRFSGTGAATSSESGSAIYFTQDFYA